MATIVLALIIAAAIAAVVGYKIWRRWIDPWRELEELVTAITSSKRPRKFLMTGNRRANALGLALEKFADRQRELELVAAQGSSSLQTILGALPDGLAIVDEKRRLQIVNREFRRTFGLEEEAEGAALLEVVRDAGVDRAVASALESRELRTEPMTVGRGLDERREFEVTAVPFSAGANNPTPNAVVLFRDVTRVRAVEQMRRDFVANVSHELRTPLSIFRGYLETLLDDPRQPPQELIRILEVMDRHAERLTLLVEDILTLAKLETPGARLEYDDIYLPDFLGGILRDWEKRFGSKLLRASLNVPDDLPVISADEHRLQEVIYNLLDNAVKYSQPEGKIRLKAQREGENVRISVTDEGIGIPARDLPRIFERFYRADKARSRQMGGTGLGLSIVKHIAQLHGGSVEAASEPGRGTSISIILPVRPPAQLQTAQETAQPQLF